MPRQTNPMTTRTRGGNGRYTRTAAAIKRDHEAAEFRGRGYSFQRIADELGFASKGHAHEAVMRAYAEIPSEASEQAKALDLERIDRLIEKAWEIMLRDHVTVSQGRVVGKVIGVERDEAGAPLFGGDGKPVLIYEDILDDGPALAAIREIRGLLERRAKIIGYEAPARSRIEVITEDVIDAECAQLVQEIAQRERDLAGAGNPGAA
jgi:hypothetical protein